MKCSYAAFGEQNETDNDSKCRLVYSSQKKSQRVTLRFFDVAASKGDSRDLCY